MVQKIHNQFRHRSAGGTIINQDGTVSIFANNAFGSFVAIPLSDSK